VQKNLVKRSFTFWGLVFIEEHY